MNLRLPRPSLIFIFSLIFTSGIAQKFNPYYNFKHLNVQNGLIQNIVYHFLQDSRGYLWIGTRNGITLFDGIRTINFQHDANNKRSLAGNFITRILEDADHVVWIGNDAGIDRYNRENNDFTHFSIPATNGKQEDTYCVLLGFGANSDLWFIDTRSKALKVFNTKSRHFRAVQTTDAVDATLQYDSISAMVNIWTYLSIGTTALKFNIRDSLIGEKHFFNKEKSSVQPSLLIFHVFFQNDTTAWLSTAKGLIELNPKTNEYRIYDKFGEELVPELRYASMSPKGLLWVGTGGSGIYTFDLHTKKFIDNFRNYALDPFSICSNNIVSLYFDRVGNIWCGSYGSGISYANVENNFFSKSLSKEELDKWKKENNISWIGTDKQQNTWCLMQDVQGFWLLDSALQVKSFRRPLLENGQRFVAAVYQLLFESKTTAWCTTDRGLFQYNPETNRIKQVDYPKISDALFGSYWSKVIIRLHDGSVLFSTFGGLYRITNNHGKYSVLPFSILNDVPFSSFDMVFEDTNHRIYVKDIGETFYVLSPADANFRYKLEKTIKFKHEIFQMQEAGSNLYMGTNEGLFLLNKNNLKMESSPINALLPFRTIKDLLIEKNIIWLFGEKGLYYFNTDEKTGRLFTSEDGLPSNEFSEYCLVRASTGNFIVGTSNGLVSFTPGKLRDIIYPPRAQINNIYVNDSSSSFLPNPQEREKILLSHGQNTFSFDFSCISFQHADATGYEYKLDRYDEKWIRSGTTHYTRYSRIAPGNYTFILRVLDANGKISPYTKSIAIEIEKAFWQTTIFKLLLSALALFFIWLLIKWYLRTRIRKQRLEFERQQAIEKERTRIATDMHDDLGAGLSRIKFLSETIGLKKQMQQPIEDDISSIGEYANEMITKMGEIVWALNEKNDSLSDLLSYTRSYAAEYLLQGGIICSINSPSSFPSIFVSGEFRRNIYLTIKEALHNIVKHSQAKRVAIEIKIEGDLFITIRDDGIGFDPLHIRPFSNGLNNMQKRMKEISGTMQIIHRVGTTIKLSAPLGI
ncbi:MAG: two-component regulator propeller domain-containing protein [Chitinophagales bacterium]